MTVNTDIFRRAGVDAETDERAQQAVKAFRALQPTLSAYARVLTKNKSARVEMAARDNGSTDGRRIFYRPPIALGDKTPHDRSMCDKRDEHKQLLCPACAIREEVLVTIYHEIAHIAFDSFAKATDADRKRAIEGAIKESGGRWAKEIAAKIEALPAWRKESYMGLASCINEFFPYLVNCLEDARVNRELFKAREGVRKMFDADTWKIFTQGVEQKDKDGKIVVIPWKEYPLNTQVMVGTFCKASGYDYSNWFHPRVVGALNDAELTQLIGRMDTVRSAGAVYHLAFLVMARLRELGFLGTPADPDPEPEPEENEGDTSDEPQDADQQESGEQSPDSDPVSGQSESESSSGDESDSGVGEEDSDSEPDASEADEGSGAPSGEEESTDEDAGPDQQEPAGTDNDAGQDAGDSSESASDGEASDGGDTEATDSDGSASGDNSADEGDEDSEDGRSQGEGDSLDERDQANAQEGASGGDFVPGDDAAEGEQSSDDEVSEGSQVDDASPSESSDGDADDEPAEGPRGEGDIDSPSDGGTPEEASADPSAGADTSGGRDSEKADPEEAVEDASEPGSAEGGSDVASTDEDGNLPEGDDGEEAVDTGADDGYGGTALREKEEDVAPDPPMGTPEEVETAILKWGDHEEKPKSLDAEVTEEAVDRAIVQGIYFTTPSRNIFGVREHRYGSPVIVGGYNMSNAWDHNAYLGMGWSRRELGIVGDFSPPESILGEALMRMRVAFSDNKRGKELRHRKTGKVDAKVLGKRAHLKDERLFKKRILPGKKDYFVLIGMDLSGSTIGKNIALEKRAVMAQATLLDRLGVKFAIYGHSGNYHDPTSRDRKFDLDIYLIKEPNEVWDSKVKERLTEIGPDSANLDGHALEYMRKILDARRETDRIILYYSDGKMPAENETEELQILQREIRICKQKNYTLLGVGIRTDSPVRHGLDTVQVDEDGDVIKVVKHLEKRLLAK